MLVRPTGKGPAGFISAPGRRAYNAQFPRTFDVTAKIKMPSTSLTAAQMECLGIIYDALAAHPFLSWLKPSYVMATIRIESGFNPAVVNATGRRDGLMQVIPPTAAQVARLYNLTPAPQTDPKTSIISGMCYLDYCARYLLKAWGATSIYISAVEEAYNEGPEAARQGRRVDSYYMKWAFAQQGYAFVDGGAYL